MNKSFDIIIIGAGSIGVPAALNLAFKKKKVLCIDSFASPGQGNNKRAIGGVRATHSDYGKIKVCQRSIDIFSTWTPLYGYDIGWRSNGYSFPAYDEKIETILKETLKSQQKFGLNISWLHADEYADLIPGIETEGLRGGTYSPDDGSCSPLLAINAFYFKSMEYGAEYRFKEDVIEIKFDGHAFLVKTNKDQYSAEYIINAAGNNANQISELAGFTCQVTPECHEAGITDPVNKFLDPMIVDIRPEKGSLNYYFCQNYAGPVIFCITPDPPIIGTDSDTTSEFLPLCVSRMLKIYPRLKNLKIRRQWRGQYPMTPDGSPIIGKMRENPKFIQAVGMCGQGFMLGPGVGELLNRILEDNLSKDDMEVLKSFDPYRDFTKMETFK